MVGAPDMSAEAGMGLLSRSTLGLEGSSAVKTGISSRIYESCTGKTKRLYLPIVLYPGSLRTKLLLLMRKCCCAFIQVQGGGSLWQRLNHYSQEGVTSPDRDHQKRDEPKIQTQRHPLFFRDDAQQAGT